MARNLWKQGHVQPGMNRSRHSLVLAAAAASLVLLAGCSGGSDARAVDPAAEPGTTSSAPPSEPPSPAPTVGSYPAFPHEDYDFTVAVSCFCATRGEPVRIEVRDGEAVSATWARTAYGHKKGEVAQVPLVTIDDIIDQINNPKAAYVDVSWPVGQDHPSTAFIDVSRQMADEEMGYKLSDVDVLD